MVCFLGSHSSSVSVTYVLCFKMSRVCLGLVCCVFQTKTASAVEKRITHRLTRYLLPPGGCWVWSISCFLSSLHAPTMWNTGEDGSKTLTTLTINDFVLISLSDLRRMLSEFSHFIPSIKVVHPPYVPVSPFYHPTAVRFEELWFSSIFCRIGRLEHGPVQIGLRPDAPADAIRRHAAHFTTWTSAALICSETAL